jgi:hypothetical protein
LLHNVEVAEAAFLLHLCNITLKVIKRGSLLQGEYVAASQG